MKQKRPRLNSTQRERKYNQLAERDGETCWLCGKQGTRKTLEVHRIDGTKGYEDLDNLLLSCPRCNTKTDPRGKTVFQLRKVRTPEEAEQARTSSLEMQRNLFSEPRFRSWLWRLIAKTGSVPMSTAINGGAEHARCSPQTAQRYLAKFASVEGPCIIDKDDSGKPMVRARVPQTQVDDVMEGELDARTMADQIKHDED